MYCIYLISKLTFCFTPGSVQSSDWHLVSCVGTYLVAPLSNMYTSSFVRTLTLFLNPRYFETYTLELGANRDSFETTVNWGGPRTHRWAGLVCSVPHQSWSWLQPGRGSQYALSTTVTLYHCKHHCHTWACGHKIHSTLSWVCTVQTLEIMEIFNEKIAFYGSNLDFEKKVCMCR